MHICILTYKNIIMCLELEPQQQQQQLEKNFVQNSRKMNSKILYYYKCFARLLLLAKT